MLLTSLPSGLGKLLLYVKGKLRAVDKQVWNEDGHVRSLPVGLDKSPDVTASLLLSSI